MYSVWEQALGAFRYYEDGRPQATLNADAPTHLASRALGSTVDQAAWPLPSGAREVGVGPTPIGRIAARRGYGAPLDGVLEGDGALLKAGLLAGAALLLWRELRPRRRKARR